jgi:hypothetical protein
MSTASINSWWTNKRLVTFTFWAWIFGLAFVYEKQKTYDTSAVYEVQSVRVRSRIPVGQPHLETGKALAQKEIANISTQRTIGILLIVGAGIGSIAIFGRIGRGERVFRDAISR